MDKRVIPNDILIPEIASLLDEGREVSFRPEGNSMLPFFRGGKDTVVLRKQPQVKVGDIVLAPYKGRYVLHRIIKADGDRLTLMGDGNLSGTEHCRAADVIGTVVYIEKEGKGRKAPGSGRLWRALLPFRRILLGIYRRIL